MPHGMLCRARRAAVVALVTAAALTLTTAGAHVAEGRCRVHAFDGFAKSLASLLHDTEGSGNSGDAVSLLQAASRREGPKAGPLLSRARPRLAAVRVAPHGAASGEEWQASGAPGLHVPAHLTGMVRWTAGDEPAPEEAAVPSWETLPRQGPDLSSLGLSTDLVGWEEPLEPAPPRSWAEVPDEHSNELVEEGHAATAPWSPGPLQAGSPPRRGSAPVRPPAPRPSAPRAAADALLPQVRAAALAAAWRPAEESSPPRRRALREPEGVADEELGLLLEARKAAEELELGALEAQRAARRRARGASATEVEAEARAVLQLQQVRRFVSAATAAWSQAKEAENRVALAFRKKAKATKLVQAAEDGAPLEELLLVLSQDPEVVQDGTSVQSDTGAGQISSSTDKPYSEEEVPTCVGKGSSCTLGQIASFGFRVSLVHGVLLWIPILLASLGSLFICRICYRHPTTLMACPCCLCLGILLLVVASMQQTQQTG